MRWAVEPEYKAPKWETWHRWFAWHPITVGEVRVWMEWVDRKGEEHAAYDSSWIEWEYRLLEVAE